MTLCCRLGFVCAALSLPTLTQAALGQVGLTGRRTLVVSPPRAMLGQPVTLSVQGATQGARYRYVATIAASPGAGKAHETCPTTLAIGSGARVTWQPKSGSYRLTAYGPAGHETDTLTATYVVAPRSVMLATSQTPAQPSGVTLVLRTDDLGPGHKYEWWMEYSYTTGDGNQRGVQKSPPWMTQTNGPMATYPSPIPAAARISAKVSIHRGDPCDIIAVGTKD